MRLGKGKIAILGLLIAVLFASSRTEGQSQTTGDIAGNVTDPSAAVVPGAMLKLTDNSKGTSQTTTTNKSGNYHFSLLAPGAYTLDVSASGFQDLSRPVQVSLGTVVTANVQLTVGPSSQSVMVTESEPLIQVQNGDTANTISEKLVQQIPNPGNDLTFTAELSAGVVANTSGGGLGNFSSFGLGADANLFTIDGMDDNDPFLNLNNSGATDLMLGNDEVQEVSVVQNGYSAEYGGLAGAQINYVTRGGSNEFHGRATYYWDGRDLNANNFFSKASGLPRPFVNSNSWGADLGGPLVKNKVFWYVNTEGLYLVIPTSGSETVIPSPQFATATETNIRSIFGTGSKEDAFYTNIFKLYAGASGASSATPLPAAGGLGCDSSIGIGGSTALATAGFGTTIPCALQFSTNVSNLTHDWIFAGRMDWNIGSNDRMYTRIQKEHGLQASITDPINPLFNLASDQPEYQGQYQWTHVIGTNSVNQFNASAIWYSATFNNPDRTAALASFPTTLSFATAFSNLGGFQYVAPQGRNVTQLQLSDDYSKTINRHTLNIGFKFRRNWTSDLGNGVYSSGIVTVEDLDAFYMGGYDPTTAGPSNPNISNLEQSFAQVAEYPVKAYNLGGYVEDDWRVTSNLMLNLGLRLEHQSNPVCPVNCFAAPASSFESLNHDPTIPYNQAIMVNRAQALPSLTAINPEPRFGFAYSPNLFGNHNTVIRGGIGLFYDAYPDVVVENFAQNPPLYNLFGIGTATSPGYITPGGTNSLFTKASASNAALASGFSSGATLASLSAAVPGFAPPDLTGAINPRTPQVQKWSLEIQHAFGQNASFDIGYVGNHAIHLPYFNNGLNAYDPAGFADFPLSPTDQRFGAVTEITSTGVSNYNGLVTSFKYRFGTSQLLLNYTYSHALDVSSNSGNPNVPFTSTQYSATNNSASYPEDPFHPRKYNYGNSDYDVTHYFSASYVIDLPIRRALMGHGWSRLVDGWQMAGTVFARTGLPYSLIDGETSGSLFGDNYGAGAYIFGTQLAPGGQDVNCLKEFPGQPVPNRGLCLNTANFTDSPTTFGNVTRNQLRGPGYFNTDLTLMKYTKLPVWEKAELGLGFQFFNLFNHPNFQAPPGDLSNPLFGQISSTVSPPTSIFGSGLGADASPRLIQVKAQFRF